MISDTILNHIIENDIRLKSVIIENTNTMKISRHRISGVVFAAAVCLTAVLPSCKKYDGRKAAEDR